MSVAQTNFHRPPVAVQQGALFGSEFEDALQTAIASSRYVPFEARLRANCFLFGALCAKSDVVVPEWLNGAPLWAHGAALKGYVAFLSENVNRIRTVPTSAKSSRAIMTEQRLMR